MSSSPFSFDSSKNLFSANPFDRKDEDEGVVAATAPEGSYTYAMVASQPAVDPSEVETNVAALEVTVKWGANVLHVAHLSPVRSFSVGEEGCDFTVSRDVLGADKVEVVRVAAGSVILPSLGDKKLEGDAKESVRIGTLTFDVKCTKAGRKVAGATNINKRAVGLGAVAALLHGGIFAAMFAFTPSLEATDSEAMASDQAAKVNAMFQAMAEKEQASNEARTENHESAKGGESGEKAKGAEGQAGTTTPTTERGHFAVKGTSKQVMISRAEAIKDAQDFGMIGLLSTLRGDDNTLTANWADHAQGNDPFSTNGNMWADSLGASQGAGGLGLSSDGLGGGGRAENVALGDIGTGHSLGNCFGPLCTGFSTGGSGGSHDATNAPKIRQKPVEGSTRIPAEVIQRVIQRNYGRFRGCYENGLKSNPALAGRVSVAMTIGADGSVNSVTNAGSDLPDAGVVSCIVRSFGGLNFPAPDAVVHIVYPLALSPQ
ncbi:MAG: AgmX/PglI C-terminal domain-containing protein [Polyangiaceae bacterium]